MPFSDKQKAEKMKVYLLAREMYKQSNISLRDLAKFFHKSVQWACNVVNAQNIKALEELDLPSLVHKSIKKNKNNYVQKHKRAN